MLIISVNALRVDGAVVPQFEDAATAAISGSRHVVVALAPVTFLDGKALGALIRLRKEVGREGTVAIAGAQPAVVNLLRLTRLDEVFPMYHCLADAISAQESA